jgi:hypothetical protein
MKNYKVNRETPLLPDLDESPSILNMFDEENPDINLFNFIDDELIRLGGSDLLYFKYMQSESNYDDVYMEERNKPVVSEPVTVHGHYDPKVLEENLTEFGIELTNDQMFVFNKSYIETKLSRRPIPGDVIQPKFQNQKYEIFEVQEDSFEIYGVYHFSCSARLLRDSSDVQDTPLHKTSKSPGVASLEDLEEDYG